MPYKRDNSVSPERRLYSVSPPPSAQNGAGPSKKAKTTVNDVQRRNLEKLLQNPNKEVALPTEWEPRKLEAPPDMVKNISGSVSGAGSGEFHVYKASRRREFERIKQMEHRAKEYEEQQAFKERQAAYEAEAEAKTAKNRNKRLKRKAGRKGGAAAAGAGAGGAGGGGADAGAPKRKLANGAILVGRTDAEPDAESEGEDEGDDAPATTAEETASAPASAEPPRVVVETKTLIHDDD